MTRWEYLKIDAFEMRKQNTDLNKLGKQGWELITIFERGLIHYFKRKKSFF